ncbi:MAG: aminotransferase class I/II-fold pyridoxal phosphate-dependent enzyme [Thermoplasmata archaeon]
MEYFEIGKWIEGHRTRYDLMNSGFGRRNDIKKYIEKITLKTEDDVKEDIANLYSIDKRNIALTHGATEGYSIFIFINRKKIKCRYHMPEYELIYKVPKLYDIEEGNDVICASNPHNPTGEFLEMKNKSIIDETFLFFYMDPNKVKYENSLSRINTFTKFFHDEVRLGWIISNDTDKIESLRGIMFERVSSVNLGIAHEMLKDYDNIKEHVRTISEENLNYIKGNKGKLRFYRNSIPVSGTVVFMDYSEYSDQDSIDISGLLYENGISVVPSRYFGIEGPYIRIAYTSENFREGYDHLLTFFENLERYL